MAKFESDDNPLPRLGKRGIDWEYAELLPGHESPRKKEKNEKTFKQKELKPTRQRNNNKFWNTRNGLLARY